MTCLEHLIENTLCNFKKHKSYEEIMVGIKKDINLKNAGITEKQCWEICQYVWWDFVHGILGDFVEWLKDQNASNDEQLGLNMIYMDTSQLDDMLEYFIKEREK